MKVLSTGMTFEPGIMEAMSEHPCYNAEAHKKFARMHIPVAPKCNIQCNYCNRKFDCCNESRPGVTSEVLTPAMAAEKIRYVKEKIPELRVIGIAGPGDPLANEETFESLDIIKRDFPELTLCVSTNGLALPENAERLHTLGVRFLTVTMNAVDPDVGAHVYGHVRGMDGILKGREAAEYLLGRQLEGIRRCVELGMVVKINIVMIPGINDTHIPEVVRTVKGLGVHMVNILPLIPVQGTPFANMRAPTPRERRELMDLCSLDVKMMRHCRQCRADAIGLLGEDRSQEFVNFGGCGSGCGPTGPAAKPLVPIGQSNRVAVASSDDSTVDSGFGNTERFLIYELRDGFYTPLGERMVPESATVAGKDHREHITSIADLLSDCGTVIVSEIGSLPMKVLTGRGVNVVVAVGPIYDALHSL